MNFQVMHSNHVPRLDVSKICRLGHVLCLLGKDRVKNEPVENVKEELLGLAMGWDSELV